MPFKDPAAQREYQRQWMAARRAEHLADACCVDCGSTDSLQLDHLDPALKINHRVWSWSEGRRLAEIAKCVVRCEPCHRERHAVARRRHGRKRYDKGCRCDVCRAAKREANARGRANRKARADQLLEALGAGDRMRTGARVRRDNRADVIEAVRQHAAGVRVADAVPFTNRTCVCGAEFCLRETDLRKQCARCRKKTTRRKRDGAKAQNCRGCGARLLVPTAAPNGLCGFCCAELDHPEESEAA